MKPSVQNFKSDQPKMLSKREDKKSVNHKWNSRLYFQLGLIVSLAITIVVIESTYGLTVIKDVAVGKDPIMDPPTVIYEIEKPKPVVVPVAKVEEQKPIVREKVISEQIAVVKNDLTMNIETPVAATDTPTIPVNTTTETTKPTTIVNPTMDVLSVEFVPVFPGCESSGSNEERRMCMQDKIRAFISKKFNTDEFAYLDSGKQFRIDVQFMIDKNGNVQEVRSRAPERSLEHEAERVIKLLPTVKPGMQGKTPVDVIYRIPIIFKTN
jgi:protein TonB